MISDKLAIAINIAKNCSSLVIDKVDNPSVQNNSLSQDKHYLSVHACICTEIMALAKATGKLLIYI